LKEEDSFGRFIDSITTEIGMNNILIMVLLAASLILFCSFTYLVLHFCLSKEAEKEKKHIEKNFKKNE